MTEKELYTTLKEEFKKIVAEHDCGAADIKIRSAALSPEEAIGITERKDYPILDGSEVMLQAEYNGCLGRPSLPLRRLFPERFRKYWMRIS